MPLHLMGMSRRAFVKTLAAAGTGALVLRPARGASAAPMDRWALLSDTHIAADPAAIQREVNMADHLRAVLAEVLAPDRRPAGLFINGDLALNSGLAGDYATFKTLLKPVVETGIPVHVTLGNHDDRANVVAAEPAGVKAELVHGHLASVVETPLANWVLLDSLEKVNSTPGLLGPEQLAWLAAALDRRRDKPALVMMHHHPQVDAAEKISGLRDTDALLGLLLPRRHVKALFFGHTHRWSLTEQDGLHLVNLPAVAYVFAKAQPSGWVDCRLRADGAKLELRSLAPAHPAHGVVRELRWR
jgi:3',5'-cyclic AMP phosphodiesterase CpdA